MEESFGNLEKRNLSVSWKNENGKKVPCTGELWYRGYNVENLIKNLGRLEMGFEKNAYLLVMGELPDEKELQEFRKIIGDSRTLPTNNSLLFTPFSVTASRRSVHSNTLRNMQRKNLCTKPKSIV